MSTAFVGRQPELERLEGLLRRARAGAAVAAVIRGDPGSGKSRLLGEVVERYPIRHRAQLLGFEPTQSIPLASAAELLRWLRRVPVEGPRLESLVFAADTPEARDPVRIFEAAHRALAAAGPALVVVDDTQWLDDLTVALLLYLIRAAAAGSGGLALLAAGRPSPVSNHVTRAIEAALPVEHRAVLDLAPLSRSDGIELARGLDGTLDEQAALELWRRAAGSPFWLETLALRRAAGTVADVIGQRLASLGPDAASLMAALGVAGRPYLLEQLRDVLEWDDTRVAAATRELASSGLLTQRGGTVRIAHDLIREEAASGIRPSLRRRLHARIAATIEAEAGDDFGLLREALEHRIAAGMDPAGLALRLASSPQRRLLGRDGLQVLAAIADALPAGSEEQITLDERLGEIAASLADQELAEDRWTRVADAGAPFRRRRALIEAGWAAYHRQDGPRARSLAGLARSVMARDDLSETAALAADPELLEEATRLHTLEADVALWLEHDTVGGQGAAAIGLAMARRLAEVAGGVGALLPSHRAAYLRALESAMDAALQADRGAEVVELGDETLRVAERGGSDARAAALNRVAFAMASIGLVRDAARLYGEAWDLANDLVLPSAAVDAGHGLASALHQVGPVPRAREMALATMDLESRLRNAPRRWGHAGPALHNIELSLGEPVAALRFLREDAAHEADPHFRLGIHQTIALWEARLGGPGAAARASAELDAATSDWALVRCPRCGRELGIHAVEVRARIGEVEEARRALAAWDAEVPTPGFGAQRWRQTAEAMLRAGEGDVAAATDGLRDSATEATAGGRISDATWAWLDAGRLLAETDRRAAIEALSQAATLGEQAGLVTQVRLASLLLRRLGVRAWRRGASGGVDRLSEREAEIARLVASGASNREIAETLLIAPKTVERHVSNALTKLGLRNRTELAGLVRSDASVRVPPDDRQTGPT